MALALLPYLISLAVALSAGGYCWSRRRNVAGAREFAVLLLFECLWTAGYIGELLADGVAAKLVWDDLQWFPTVAVAASGALFARVYTGVPLRHPARTWAAVLTPAALGPAILLAWPGLRDGARILEAPPFGALVYPLHGLDWLLALYGYAGSIYAVAVLVHRYRVQHRLFRRQTLVVIIGMLLPMAGGVLAMFDLRPLGQRDLGPHVLAVANLVVLYALFRLRLFEVGSVARDEVFTRIPDAVLVLDDRGRVLDLNPAAEQLVGPAAAAVGQTLAEVTPAHPALIAQATGEQPPGEIALIVGGDRRVFDVQRAAVGGGTVILLSDVTAVRAAQVAEREAGEERFRRVFEVSPDSLAVVRSDDNRFLDVNPRFTELFGYRRGEVIGRTAIDLGIWNDPDDRLALVDALERDGRVDGAEVRCRRRDGGQVDGLVAMRWIEVDGVRCVLFAFRDITERQQARAEERRLMGELQDRNAEMQQFVYTVSHDLKSPLVTIKGFIGSVRDDLTRGRTDRAGDDLDRIASAADRMLGLLEALLELSRVGRVNHAIGPVSLDDTVRVALELVDGAIRGRGVHVVVAPDLPVVLGDPVRLGQVMQNLIENAVKYMGAQAAPRVEIGARVEGEWAVISVRDNGIGIEPRHAERIFGLFEKLDRKSDGTGIGLALVRRIVELSGGKVWAESEGIGRGTTFVMRLRIPESGDGSGIRAATAVANPAMTP